MQDYTKEKSPLSSFSDKHAYFRGQLRQIGGDTSLQQKVHSYPYSPMNRPTLRGQIRKREDDTSLQQQKITLPLTLR